MGYADQEPREHPQKSDANQHATPTPSPRKVRNPELCDHDDSGVGGKSNPHNLRARMNDNRRVRRPGAVDHGITEQDEESRGDQPGQESSIDQDFTVTSARLTGSASFG
jgi:hypothetical protein